MLKKVAIVGPESTGKSELCQHLARIFETEWVPEYARIHLDRLNRPYNQDDLSLIAKGQLAWEEDKAQYAEEYLFCDTNLIVIKVWSDHAFGGTEEWIEKDLRERKYDFYLLANIDLAWRPDPQREHPKLRSHFFDVYKNYLEDRALPYAIISGIEDVRTDNAVKAIKTFFAS